MELSQGIRRLGFRRWYERELIESHLYLVSCILCLIAVFACLEGFSLRAPGWEVVMRLLAMAAGGFVCIWTLRRYMAMLGYAMRAAERSVCEKCATYRGLDLSATVLPSAAAAEGITAPVRVRCRHCRHEWTIE
ncbi:MAG: hypothetical protein ACREUN_16085 [Burkholderiales bacterium]